MANRLVKLSKLELEILLAAIMRDPSSLADEYGVLVVSNLLTALDKAYAND